MNTLTKIKKAERILACLLANLEGRATETDLSYSIADRSISKMSLTEMQEQYYWWSKHLAKLKLNHKATVNSANGKRTSRSVLARFSA